MILELHIGDNQSCNMNKILLIIVMFALQSCKHEIKAEEKNTQNQKNVEIISDEAIESIKEFYLTFYGVETPPKDNDLKKKYISERILNRFDSLTSDGENLILDYDPFIRGQDYNPDTIKKTLKIEALKNKDEYRVSFLLFGSDDEKRTFIDYLLKKNEKGRFLIYSIINDDFFNFNTNSINIKTINNEEELGKLIFSKSDKGLVINEKLLSEVEKLSKTDHGKKASMLRGYVNELINNRNNQIGSIFTDKELYKIIAYTINTSDPIYYKYYDDKNIFWGKYGLGGDSRGGASFSDALSIGKLLSSEELDEMTQQFRLNNYYNLPNLKNMLEKSVWF